MAFARWRRPSPKIALQLLIWLATAFFVVMMFTPLVFQLVRRLTQAGAEGIP